MANNLSFDQVSTLLNATLEQVRGVEPVGEITLHNFAAVGQTLLKAGYDNLLNAISVVLSDTYFSIRPYGQKFGGLFVDSQQWGGYVRKIQVVDKEAVDNDEYDLQDGPGVDHYAINKPLVLQLNFYGGTTYSRDLPIFKNQLDIAFSSAEELGRFWSMLYQNLDDMVTQDRETQARLAVCNFIGGKIKGDADNVVHLVQRYNDITGKALTDETVHAPENWRDFCLWMFGYIKTLSEQLTERTQKFHINVAGKPISRHTPLDRQKVYLLNTGWTGGGYGVGKRMDIPVTRACIDGILNGSIEKAPLKHNDRFNLEVPTHVEGVDDSLLWPRNTWADKEEYDRVALKLAGKFVEHFKQFQVPGLPDYSPYGPQVN